MSPEERSNAELAREEFDASQVDRIEQLEADNKFHKDQADIAVKDFYKLEAENIKLKECVQFYADKSSYKTLIDEEHTLCLIVSSDTGKSGESLLVGGKLARQTLSEIKENRK